MFSKEEFLAATKEVSDACKEIVSAERVIALTGSGISVASGIPPFNGEGGLWERYDPEEVAHIRNFKNNPRNSWTMIKELLVMVQSSMPNPAHQALAKLEKMGHLKTVITQNIDGLHQEAGNQSVIEFHGNSRFFVCLTCRAEYPVREISIEIVPVYCPTCGGLLKPNVIFFGEDIPKYALFEAHALSEKCQVMLIVGASGMVEPAASLPVLARKKGAFVIEVNREPTIFTSTITDLFIRGHAERVLPVLVDEIDTHSKDAAN